MTGEPSLLRLQEIQTGNDRLINSNIYTKQKTVTGWQSFAFGKNVGASGALFTNFR